MKDNLQKILFASPTNVYAILDGAQVDGLREKMFLTAAINYCLFPGDLEPDMATVAPYMVRLKPGTEFCDWLLDADLGKHWGIFAHSRHSIIDLRKHFRSLASVHDEDGRPMKFRFYDPRVLHKYLPTCNGSELKTFFGPIDAFFAESGAETLTSYSLENAELRRSDLNVTSEK
ncbi:MAG: DUF4123 domain-containing protein [Acidobacteriota bacterium]